MNTFDIILGIILITGVIFLGFKYKSWIRKQIQERTEKNAVKIPDVTYTIGKGENKRTITEDIVIKRSTIPLIGDWSRVYPVVNEEGKTNWINLIFGGKKNLIKLLIILGIVAMILLSYYELFSHIRILEEQLELFKPLLN